MSAREDAGAIFIVLGLFDALAAEKGPGQFEFIHAAVGFLDGPPIRSAWTPFTFNR